MCQPPLTGFFLEPALIKFMLRVLNALQFVQKNLEVSRGDNKLFDVVIHWVVVLANVLGDGQFPGAVVVGQTLRDQECRD